MREYEPKTIICPQCSRKVGRYDGRSKMEYSTKCNKCGKLVTYNPETNEVELKPMPQRHCGSGLRFY